MYRNFFKRIFDFLIALSGIIILSPMFIVLIVWLHFDNKAAGVFFIQRRPGKNGKIFKLIKFKTMTDEQDTEGRLLLDKQRLTKIGKFMRSTSIDELPQLVNVLKGDMSLVGPRPLAVQYLPFYSDMEHRRHLVRPGLTGLAQINGRNGLSWESKFAFDIEYVDRLCFMFDIKIIYKTISKVLSRENIGIIGIDAPEDFDKYRIKQNPHIKQKSS
jgi:undecaprenyl phosphate N,N'-diacetylbacillosamine 1-phosphate transferase